MATIMELVTYNLKDGVTKADIAQTEQAMNQFLQQQEGFIYRSLSHDEYNLWHDTVYWRDMTAAKAGGEAFMASEAGQALAALINMDSCKMRHMEVQSEVLYADADMNH